MKGLGIPVKEESRRLRAEAQASRRHAKLEEDTVREKKEHEV
jgi:hypothetical protein